MLDSEVEQATPVLQTESNQRSDRLMKSIDPLNNLRVASPCPISWEQMTGDDRVRFCDQCSLHVYNIANLTRSEATRLIAGTEGSRLCARIYRRSDGTIITKDCPIGLRAIRRRLARRTAALFAAVASLSASAFSYARRDRVVTLDANVRHSGTATVATLSADLSGSITDPRGEPIQGAIVTLTNLETNQKRVIKSDKKGRYYFFVSRFGSYRLRVAADYFNPFEQDLRIHFGDDLRVDISLMVGSTTGVVVIEKIREKGMDIDGIHVRVNDRD